MGKQITMFDPTLSMGGCGECVCKDCLYWWSGRCPYGECYDDYRAKNEPYDKALSDWSTAEIDTIAQMGLHRTEKIWFNFEQKAEQLSFVEGVK